jgi:hypothetical protein
MNAEADLQEYLEEIRQEVCSRCVERPAGGPPCTPLGKVCGVELHLPQLVAAVQAVHSIWMGPYLDSTHKKVCERCDYLHKDCCPCPMDSLAVLVVEAIETVDSRRQQRGKRTGYVPQEGLGIEDVVRTYEEATGKWNGCDWPVFFGPARLSLQGCSAAEAQAWADTVDVTGEGGWAAAACWLEEVERRTSQAEDEAVRAVAAAQVGDWEQAVEHARTAWLIEFNTGRPLRHPSPTWMLFSEVVEAAAANERVRVPLALVP